MTYFIIDENLSFEIVTFLNKMGYKSDHIKKMGLGGTKNGELYKIIAQNKAWFITKDKDFSVKEKFDKYNVAGIIVLNLTDEKTNNIKKYIEKVFSKIKHKFDVKKLILVRDTDILILE